MKNLHQMSVDEIFKKFNASENGIEFYQIENSRQKYGQNEIEAQKPKSIARVFLEQFLDLLVIILITAAGISLISGNIESTVVIFIVIILNAVLGTVQHFKAEKSLKSLKDLSAPMAKVIRSGKKKEILSSDVVVGDILTLEAGDMVCADGRIIKNFSLQVNESSLTGESEAVVKTDKAINQENIAIGDSFNMVFSSGLVTYGRAHVLVTSVGMNTELGKIAQLMNQTKAKKTPLQISLDNFSKKLSIIIILICIAVFCISLYREMPILDSLMFSVALAVAAIPEALSSIVTISLAIGTSKMAKQNAIIKNLRAVEGLGCVSIVCSDKTGTLTQNKMTVRETFVLQNSNEEYLLKASVLCNDSYYSENKYIGDPTEIALLEHFNNKYNITYKEDNRLSEIPFDSDRKLMSTVYCIDGNNTIITKGAIDVLLARCTHILDGDICREITKQDYDLISDINYKFSNDGLRVLAFAKKEIRKAEIMVEDEYEYTFIGLISMIDPPREQSRQAVLDCKAAGIKPIMITGDHKITACAIAREIGIFSDGDIALEGSEIDKFDDRELSDIITDVTVYARVSPEHKIRIVDLWQKRGHIVSMTGDGVNDAPALKKADIGIAMGITGTAVSKDAASMIITDDNFETIIKSITNGRNIYNNIKNSIKFLLSGNMSGIITVLYASIMGLSMPFTAVHLLFINLLTDSLPAVAISMEPAHTDLLKEKPRKPNESILTKDFMADIAFSGMLIAVFTIIAFSIGLSRGAEVASTMAFSTLCFARLLHGFNCRGKGSIIRLGILKNKYSIYAFLIGTALLVITLFIPALSNIFEVHSLDTIEYLVVFGCAFMPTITIQIIKIIKEKI